MNQLLTIRVALQRHAIAFGLKQSAVPLSTMLCGLAIPLVALTLGWRWAFAFSALATLGLIFAFLQFGPRRMPRASVAPLAVPLTNQGTRFFTMLAAVNALAVTGITMVVSYGVVSAVDRGIDPGTAGFLLGAASVAGALARIAAGAVAANARRDALTMTAVMQMLGAVGIVIMIPLAPVAYAVGLILAFGIGWGWTGLIHFAVSQIAGAATPSATGIVQTGSYIGSAAGPLFAGIVYTAWGGQWLWALSAVLLGGAGFIAYLTAKRPRPSTPLPLDAQI